MPPKKGTRSDGGFVKRKAISDIILEDMWSPWNFYKILDRDSFYVHQWLRKEGLLADKMICPICETEMHLNKRARDPEGFKWRCQTNRGHEKSIREYSFFRGGHTSIQVTTFSTYLVFI